MREGKILLLATNNITLERNICYSGKNANEARHTIHTLRRMDAEGHSIGNHSYSHNYDYLYSGEGKTLIKYLPKNTMAKKFLSFQI